MELHRLGRRARSLVPTLLLLLSACGGSSGEALLAGQLSGEYKGQSFTPIFGVAVEYMGVPLVALGDDGINCSSPEATDPPEGHSAAIRLEAFEVGDYSSVFVNLYQNVEDFEGRGSNQGTVSITKATAESIAATISYSDTDDEGGIYRLEGDFEVIRCASGE